MEQKIIQPLLLGPARASQLQKPLLVIAITDGAPAGEATNKSESVGSVGADNSLFGHCPGEPGAPANSM